MCCINTVHSGHSSFTGSNTKSFLQEEIDEKSLSLSHQNELRFSASDKSMKQLLLGTHPHFNCFKNRFDQITKETVRLAFKRCLSQ